MTVTIALAIPHTPWIPARVESYHRIYESLLIGQDQGRSMLTNYSVFDERESNRLWSQKLFRWALDTGASHLLQLQDDAIVSPNFWPALHAMIEAQPDRIIGLEATHPLIPVQHKAGRRWYRDYWLIGVGYVFPRVLLAQYVAWCEANPALVAEQNEDSLISLWAHKTGVAIFHPIPTIIDHDLGVESTYGNDGHYEFSMYRKPLVTWRDVPSLAALEDADYWRCSEESAPLLPGPGTSLCWYCAIADGKWTSAKTGARMCKQCMADMLGFMLNRF